MPGSARCSSALCLLKFLFTDNCVFGDYKQFSFEKKVRSCDEHISSGGISALYKICTDPAYKKHCCQTCATHAQGQYNIDILNKDNHNAELQHTTLGIRYQGNYFPTKWPKLDIIIWIVLFSPPLDFSSLMSIVIVGYIDSSRARDLSNNKLITNYNKH